MGKVIAFTHHVLSALGILLLIALALPGLAGDSTMLIATLLVVLPWIGFAVIWVLRFLAQRKTSSIDSGEWMPRWLRITQMVLAFLTILCAVLAFASCGPPYMFSLFHFVGIVLFVLGFLGWWILPLLADQKRPSNLALGVVGGSFAFIIVFFWSFLSLYLEGDIDPNDYEVAQYNLPYESGESARVVQGNDSSMNHDGDQMYAWDFRMACGTDVVAARDGKVKGTPIDSHDENGRGKPNNEIMIEHSDGTVAHYLHIQKGSAKVTSGQTIAKGDVIARVGNVGNSMTGHLHFHVLDSAGKAKAVRFTDVERDEGIPRLFGSYESAND